MARNVPLAIVQVGMIILQLLWLFQGPYLSYLVEKSRVKVPTPACEPTPESQAEEHEESMLLAAITTSPPGSETRESIASIMARTGTEKLFKHAYDRYYELHFKEYRDKEGLKILEIGVHSGKSMQLWSEYFSDAAAIHGISYGDDAQNMDPKKMVCEWNPATCDKVTIFRGDQSDPVFLKSITDKYTYDIIIDDGSHIPSHQIISLKHLFSAVNPGGLYVIEGLETSYWDAPGAVLHGHTISAGIGASPKVSAVEKLKQFIDVMMRFHFARPELSIFPEDDKFFSITFGQGLAIIRKSTEAEMRHHPFVAEDEAPVIQSGIDEWAARARESNP